MREVVICVFDSYIGGKPPKDPDALTREGKLIVVCADAKTANKECNDLNVQMHSLNRYYTEAHGVLKHGEEIIGEPVN